MKVEFFIKSFYSLNMKKAILPLSFLIINFIFVSCNSQKDIKSFEAMNTFMTIQSFGSKAKKANIAVQTRIENLEKDISTTKEESFIYKINHNNGNPVQVNSDTFELINFAINKAYESEGALNIALYPVISAWGFTNGNYRIPAKDEIQNLLTHTDYTKIILRDDKTVSVDNEMKIDLGALGKGYAGDEAIKILKNMGIKSAILDLGGNIQTLGAKTDGSDWTVGIKNPWGENGVIAGIKIRNQAVITSGGYERFFTGEDGKKYIHIFDGKEGRPVENEIASVTIISDSGLYGDTLSTTMYVMGLEKACKYWMEHRDYEMVIITKDQQLYYTTGLKDKLILRYDFSNIFSIQ